MILADTSVWIDHFRKTDPRLVDLLNENRIAAHPFVTGELALGGLKSRAAILSYLGSLQQLQAATDDEVLHFIEATKLYGIGIGYIDAHLLASARLAQAQLWTHDKRLSAAASRLNLTPVH